jgi:hypothetical protein
MAGIIWGWEFNGNRRAPVIKDEAPPPPVPDEAWQRLLKAVPVTAVSFITSATPFWVAAEGTLRTVLVIAVFGLGLVFAFLEMTVLRKVGILEVSVAIAAYLVWTYAQGGIFDMLLHWYQPLVAGVIVVAFVTALVFVPLPKPTTS